MRSIRSRMVVGAFMIGMTLGVATAQEGLKVGDQAPDFELAGSDGERYRLSDYSGEKVVVLAWFPKAFTGG